MIPPVAIAGATCSSTRDSGAGRGGRTVGAAPLLGRPFELEGRGGARRGPRPRPRLSHREHRRPRGSFARRSGIYAARARVLDGPLAGQVHAAALSVGRIRRFTAADVSVEAYLLDFEVISTIGGCASRSASDCATS